MLENSSAAWAACGWLLEWLIAFCFKAMFAAKDEALTPNVN